MTGIAKLCKKLGIRFIFPSSCSVYGYGKEIFSDKVKKDLINVFVPTTPNPTSGFLLMFPKDEVIYLDLTFEQASKFIVSAGTSNPD